VGSRISKEEWGRTDREQSIRILETGGRTVFCLLLSYEPSRLSGKEKNVKLASLNYRMPNPDQGEGNKRPLLDFEEATPWSTITKSKSFREGGENTGEKTGSQSRSMIDSDFHHLSTEEILEQRGRPKTSIPF